MSSLKEDFSIKRFLGFICANLACFLIAYKKGFFINSTDPIEKYGFSFAAAFYLLKITTSIARFLFKIYVVGSTFFVDDNNKKRKALKIPKKTICFRVVTRGTYPRIIKKNLEYNLSVIKGFENLKYTYEVVTDKKIGDIDTTEKCYEVVVPDDYTTKTGAKFKARALQYAVEQNMSNLNDNDLLVHLDEESRLTKSCIIGIIDFANQDKHQIGQGVVTYGKEEVVNWMNTLSDSTRISHDIGSTRFALRYLNKAIMNFKGSFFVCEHGVEKSVTFDHGLEGSITEDAFFAIKASNYGYSFDWIEGEIYEQSPFTFMDIVRQRRRWYQGSYYIGVSNNLKRDISGMTYRLVYFDQVISAFSTLLHIINLAFPVSFNSFDVCLDLFLEAALWYLYLLGYFNNFNFDKISWHSKILHFLAAPFIQRYVMIFDLLAIIWAHASSKSGFQIVEKDKDTKTSKFKI